MDIELSAPYYRLQTAQCLGFDSGSTAGPFRMVHGSAVGPFPINDIWLSRTSPALIGGVVACFKAMLARNRYNSGPALRSAGPHNQLSHRSQIGRDSICG